MDQEFVFDTGCEITTVSEDVATALGLPSGGRELRLTGVRRSAGEDLPPTRSSKTRSDLPHKGGGECDLSSPLVGEVARLCEPVGGKACAVV